MTRLLADVRAITGTRTARVILLVALLTTAVVTVAYLSDVPHRPDRPRVEESARTGTRPITLTGGAR